MNKHVWQLWLGALLIAVLMVPDKSTYAQNRARQAHKPYRIYAITYRGITDIEKGFEEYFRSRKIRVEITWRDLNLDPSRFPRFIEEIRAMKPDLVYTWGTSVTLGVVGPHDAVDPRLHITDTPVVFTLVAAPVLAKIVPDLKSSGRNVTGRQPRRSDRYAVPRDGVVPPVQAGRRSLHADREEFGRAARSRFGSSAGTWDSRLSSASSVSMRTAG